MQFIPRHNRSNFRSARSLPLSRAGSFKRHGQRAYTFSGVIDRARLEVRIELTGGFRYAFLAEAKGVNLNGTTNPVQVSLGIGDNAGLTSVKAHFERDHQGHRWTDD